MRKNHLLRHAKKPFKANNKVQQKQTKSPSEKAKRMLSMEEKSKQYKREYEEERKTIKIGGSNQNSTVPVYEFETITGNRSSSHCFPFFSGFFSG
jgi:hypothetical protein